MTIYKIYINLYIDNSTIKHKKEMDIMKKLFLSLLLAIITVTSIKPAEQGQTGSGWLQAGCFAAGTIMTSYYLSGTNKKTKNQRNKKSIKEPFYKQNYFCSKVIGLSAMAIANYFFMFKFAEGLSNVSESCSGSYLD